MSECDVQVTGEAGHNRVIVLRELAELHGTEVVIDFHCHEGWSRPGQRYRGVALATLLRQAGARPSCRYVTVASGGYSIVLTREQAEDQRVLLALELDGEPLAAPRLVGPSEWDCFLSVKDVDRVELARTESKGTGPEIALARIGRRLTADGGGVDRRPDGAVLAPGARAPAVCAVPPGRAARLQRGEAAGLRWSDLDLEAGTLAVTYAQLHLARGLAADIRLPWQQPCPPGRLTLAHVRLGFRRMRQDLLVPASAQKPSRPGPAAPPDWGTVGPPPATTWAKPSSAKNRTRRPAVRQENNKLGAGSQLRCGVPPTGPRRAAVAITGFFRQACPGQAPACRP